MIGIPKGEEVERDKKLFEEIAEISLTCVKKQTFRSMKA